jgi:hypothetical protein
VKQCDTIGHTFATTGERLCVYCGELKENDGPQWLLIEAEALRKLRAVATELYKEDRLNGDQMRDLAHTITSVLRSAFPYEAP